MQQVALTFSGGIYSMLLLAWKLTGALLHLVYQECVVVLYLLASGFLFVLGLFWNVFVSGLHRLPTLFEVLYNGAMAAAQITKQVAVTLGGWIYPVLLLAWKITGALLHLVYQECVVVLYLLASGFLFIIQLFWNIFVTVNSTAWNYIASPLQQQGGYPIREASKIALLKHLQEMYTLILTAFLVVIITCILLWCQQKNGRRERSVLWRESTERDSEMKRPQKRQSPKSQSKETQEGIKATREAASELLRRQLHQANEALSQERDKFLCVVCLDGTKEILLKPCNHYCLCHNCSQKLRKCPVCKRRIQTTEKIFNS